VLERLSALGHRVVGCDIYPKEWNIAACESDVFFQAVEATDAIGYLEQLLEMVEREQVDYLIPLTDVEVDVLCAAKERFAALGCTVCTPNEPAVCLCRNKLAMADKLAADRLCRTIPTISPYGWMPKEFPLLLKPVRGRSSQGQVVVRSSDAFFAALQERDDYIAQPFMEGDVFTVDVARDVHGNVQALARREFLRTVNGLGVTVRILPGHILEDVCAGIAACVDIVGVVNMEFIHHGGDYFFLEVNPRFSGGVGFSMLAGVDFPALNLRCHSGDAIGKRADIYEMTLTRSIRMVQTGG